MKRRTAAEHALVRDLSIYTPRGRLRTYRPDRRHRPPSAYQCSCGRLLLGDSRRQARLDHRTHRLVVAEEARRRRTGLAAFAEKAGAL
jgi:hypothetical protein